MSSIIFECNVTNFNIIPDRDNKKNAFAVNDMCLIINLMDKDDEIIIQTEIERKYAIELAKLILLKYS